MGFVDTGVWDGHGRGVGTSGYGREEGHLDGGAVDLSSAETRE